MPYEISMSERQANGKIEEMGPDCWYRLVRNGNDLKIYISRNGDDWDLRTVFDLREQVFDIMVPVVLPQSACYVPKPLVWHSDDEPRPNSAIPIQRNGEDEEDIA